MQRLRSILFNISFTLTCFLVFLLFTEQLIELPSWLQVIGRMHPLLLHFPIVLFILAVLYLIFVEPRSNTEESRNLGDLLLLTAALSALLTAIAGIFLSKEQGYDADAIFWHKWTGIGTGLITILFYALRNYVRQNNKIKAGFSLMAVLVLLVAGHQGAGITHGENYLLAPVMPENQAPMVPIEEAEVFAHLVKPILDAKCVSCHNEKKAKGELIMETPEQLIKGGKNGKLWDSTDAQYGLLLQRIHLPLEEKKHMPPIGKPQLSDEEAKILLYWIKQGAAFEGRVVELPSSDTLRLLAEQRFANAPAASFDFAAASEETIKKLNNSNRVINPIALQSPALFANFYNAAFYTPTALSELSAIKDQLVELDLSRMPVKDEELKTIAQFSQLQKLILNFTGITGATLNELQSLKKLKVLSLAGTAIKKEQLAAIEKLPSLQKLIIWNTGVSPEELEVLKKQKNKFKYETGFRSDTMLMRLSPPVFQNDEQVISGSVPLKLKHYINGAVIRYTTDGSEPDSVNSPVYTDKAVIDRNMWIKAKAYKSGWLSSELAQQYFFRTGVIPDSVILITPPDPKYTSDRGKTLINQIKGDLNFASGKWLGYQANRMEAMLYLKKPTPVNSITLSYLKLVGSYIMPPQSVEIWGGSQPGQLKLLGKVNPEQPKDFGVGLVLPVEVKTNGSPLQYIKVIVTPVMKLPPWHPGKGDKGWAFIDEIMIN